ncbi:MAG: type 4a pilus biogenesis protein PilO [bacterium]|nr:type 4a pilus biogenesis protein PilO [bacterium]
MKLQNLNLDEFYGYLIPIVTFLVIFGLVPFVIFPQLTKIKDQSDAIRQKDQRLTRINEKLSFLAQLKNNEAALVESLNNVELALPSGKGLAPLIEGLKKLAGNSNMVLSSVTLRPGKVATASAKLASAQESSKLTLNVQLSGEIAGFEKFLTLLERAKRIVLVESFAANSNPDGESTFSLSLNAPFREVQNQATSEDQVAEDIPSLSSEEQDLYNKLQSDFVLYSGEVSACENCTGKVKNPFP